jgi:hypothetical protein
MYNIDLTHPSYFHQMKELETKEKKNKTVKLETKAFKTEATSLTKSQENAIIIKVLFYLVFYMSVSSGLIYYIASLNR